MLNKSTLFVWAASFAILAAGCGQESATTGTAGTSGGTAGTNGAAGTSGGTAGTNGGTAGTNGGTAGTNGGTAGTNGGTAGTSGGTAGTNGGTAGTNGGTAGTNGGTAGTGGAAGIGESGGRGGGTAGGGGRGGGAGGRGGTTGTGGTTGSGGGGNFTLTSPMHADGAKFNGKYTCNGGALGAGVIPELDWAGVPAGTMSFALTFIDTTLGDTSPMGQHWAMYNIPWNASTGVVAKIPEGTKTLSGDLATAKQAAPLNQGAFLAPCAQSVMNGMDDQYAFTLYALSTATLNVSGTNPTVANVLTALKAAGAPILGTAKLTGHAGLKGQ